MMGLGKPKLFTKFEVAKFSRCKNIKGEAPQFPGAPLAQGHTHFFLLVGFDDGLWQTAAACQIWSRWLHLLRKYKVFVFKRQIRFLGNPLGVRGNIRTSSIVRWKARSRLPIRDNWTFFTSSYGWCIILCPPPLLKGVGQFGAKY